MPLLPLIGVDQTEEREPIPYSDRMAGETIPEDRIYEEGTLAVDHFGFVRQWTDGAWIQTTYRPVREPRIHTICDIEIATTAWTTSATPYTIIDPDAEGGGAWPADTALDDNDVFILSFNSIFPTGNYPAVSDSSFVVTGRAVKLLGNRTPQAGSDPPVYGAAQIARALIALQARGLSVTTGGIVSNVQSTNFAVSRGENNEVLIACSRTLSALRVQIERLPDHYV